ncbi:MAG: DUF4349 domain-containing protein [Armatimonadota bacterium]|jgi:prepilin-type processing-associated H-X9-DG protein
MTTRQPCGRWIERISAWLDGEAGLIDRLLVPLHLRECECCRDWAEAARADEQEFREAMLAGAEADEEFTNAVMARVEKQARARERAGAPRRLLSTSRLVELLVVVGLLAVLGAILFPVFARSPEKARVASCLSNMKQIALALQMYAEDHDGYLPPAAGWEELVLGYANNEHIFRCPANLHDGAHYALSPFVAGRRVAAIAEPESTVMIYEVGAGGQPVFPHNDGANYGFVDGHVRWHRQEDPPGDFQASGFIPPTQSYGIAEQLKIAYAASVEVVVRNLYQSVLEAEAAVRQYGGFILESTLDGRCGHASLTLRVPTGEVGNVVNALGTLGFVAHRQISGEDLTRRYVSAGREIEQTRARSDRLEAMVEGMEEDRPRVQAEESLGSVERQATQLRDEVWDIGARTTLATVSATLREELPEPAPETIAHAFREAVGALLTTLTAVAKVGAWVLVFAPIWGAAFGLAWLALKRAVRGDE